MAFELFLQVQAHTAPQRKVGALRFVFLSLSSHPNVVCKLGLTLGLCLLLQLLSYLPVNLPVVSDSI